MSSDLRVGLVVFEHVDFWLDLANALHEMGASVKLYLSQKHAAVYMNTTDRVAERMHEVGLLSPECEVRVFDLPRIRDPRSIAAINSVAQALEDDGVDVAHLLVGPGGLWLAALAVRLRHIPVAATMIIPKPNRGDALPTFVSVAIQKLLAWGSDVVIVNGADQVTLVQEFYGVSADRVAYVPLSPPTTVVRWAERKTQEEPGTVLFFGEARPHKGLQYLVQAGPLITRRVAHARILIASRGEELRRCELMIQDRSKYEIHDGFVPGSAMAAFFQRASVVTLPYLSASTSGILLTAYVFGKPVVATRVGCLPELVEDGVTGLLVPPADPEKLADAVVQLISDDALRNQMGRAAQRWAGVQREAAARETLRAYEKAITVHGNA